MPTGGHKTRAIWGRYNIVSDEELKLAAAQLEACLAPFRGVILGALGVF